ncbi:MAG: protein kinase [Kiritimatiellae bacterium]|nr:protein kinase [Kiritimatiellia bacterium]
MSILGIHFLAMKTKNQHLATTRILVQDETILDMDNIDHGYHLSSGIGKQQLVERYHAVIEEQAIFYPVAYRFSKKLGQGRQGVVFSALRHGARECITSHAVKIFDPNIYSNAKKYWTDMGRLAYQVSRLQSIRSSNLISRDIYLETNGIGYLQMELVEGVDFQHFLTPTPLDQAKEQSTPQEWNHFTDSLFNLHEGNIAIQSGVAFYILRQVLGGLERLHSLGYIHSDVKPSNVMVDRLGYVKLIDFGRAVRANEKVSILLGNPLYMAPEIHRRQPGVIQSDLYSVGLLGLELLCGEKCVDSSNMSIEKLLDFNLDPSVKRGFLHEPFGPKGITKRPRRTQRVRLRFFCNLLPPKHSHRNPTFN